MGRRDDGRGEGGGGEGEWKRGGGEPGDLRALR